ncbi:unnamed protein product, partial [Leptidea sinapis]
MKVLLSGFFPNNERQTRQPQFGFNQNFFPRRLSDTLSSILHINRGKPISNPDYILPTNKPANNNVRFPTQVPLAENNNDQSKVDGSSKRPLTFEDFFMNSNQPAIINNRPVNVGTHINSNGNIFGQSTADTGSSTNEPSFSSFITSDGKTIGPGGNGLITGQGSNAPAFGADVNGLTISNEPAFGANSNGLTNEASTNGPAFGADSNGFVMGEKFDEPAFGANSNGLIMGETPNGSAFDENIFTTTKETGLVDRNGPGAPSSTTLPTLTPVPASGSRNNFNFGSAGIF